MQNVWEECSNKSRNAFYWHLRSSHYCHLLLEQGAHGRRERIFPHVLIYLDCLEEHIIWTYRLPSHVIFNLLQEIRWLGTLNEESRNTRSIKTNSKPSSFWPLILFSILWLLYFFILFLRLRLFAMRLLYCVVVSLFFHLRIVSKSPAEISPPIGAVFELHSLAHLPRLVKLAHYVIHNGKFIVL